MQAQIRTDLLKLEMAPNLHEFVDPSQVEIELKILKIW